MRTLRTLLLIPALLALLAGTAFAKAPPPRRAALDPSFGRDGVFTVSTPTNATRAGEPALSSVHLAVAPSGKSYAQEGTLVVGFGANGKPDQGFGNHGRVSIEPGPGKLINVAGIAADSAGRVLVAGTYEPFPGFRNPLASGNAEPLFWGNEPATEAFVERFLPSGKLDPSFGSGGILISSLGVPRPAAGTSYPSKEPQTGEYERPVVTVTAIKVDSQDRPVLAGNYVYAQRSCLYKQQFRHGIVARVTASGTVDSSFGAGGHVTTAGEEAFGLAGGVSGQWVAFGGGEAPCGPGPGPTTSTLAVFNEAGTTVPLDPSRPNVAAAWPTAVDRDGRIMFAESVPEGATQAQPKVVRLLPNGDLDTGFGHDGGLALGSFMKEPPVALAVDGRGRTVIGFSNGKFGVMRITAAGKVDWKFGNHGRLFIPGTSGEFGGLAIDSKGRILVAGTEPSGTTGQGIAIARFLPGR
ncbi:MAG: hypothetical protein JSS97_14025 [Actinobacteria bacterium]|nr:hypothetical protein [Actinomycetota bacterium]